MSAKNRDNKNRWRNITVGFRVSPEENERINKAVALSGLPKQEYCYRRCLNQDVVVQGNPRVYKALKQELAAVLAELLRIEAGNGVVDELLDYLRTRKDNELMADLNFMRELGEIIKTSRFRFISGVQEALFDNSAFRQVSSSLLKMKDRFEQVLIRSEDIAFVAQRRVLRKSSEQKALIREHLQKFCPLYRNMADRLEDYVDMFPIHPAYIDTFQHIVTVEKRESRCA